MGRTKFNKREGSLGQHSIYWKIWNQNNPEDKIMKNDGNVIHHINNNPNINDISNLKKMTLSEHSILHSSKQSKYTRKKISKANKGNKYALGFKHSEETKKKMSDAKKGDKNINFRKTFSAETIEKMKAKAALRDYKGKNNPHYGKKHSPEAIQKMKTRIISDKTRLKMSLAQKKRFSKT